MSTVNLSEALIERAKAVTGLTRRDDAVRAAIELAEASVKPKARRKSAAKPAELPLSALPSEIRQSERELRAGKGKQFTSAKTAIKWLQS